ncbi:MAG: hypothetical protein JWO03_1537 [Bacteroidetes bacterium]|nr:hypothetical protein [Bacteroidota bacterium]
MKLLLDIKDSKASDLLQILRSLSYVTTSHISDEKLSLINEVEEAAEALKMTAYQGKYKDRSFRGH